MESQCCLCQKTLRELVEEELAGLSSRTEVSHKLSNDLAYPYLLCDTCEDFLQLVVPKILEVEGIIRFDEKKDKYVLTTK